MRGRLASLMLLTIGLSVLTALPALAEPAISVTPSTGLSGGDVVRVTATGLPAGVEVRIIQCDQFNDAFDLDCATSATVTSGADGTIAYDLTLSDPVFRSQPFGDPTTVLCRADVCRIFVAWTDPVTGATQVLASEPLFFEGSPLTMETSRAATGIRKQRVLHLTGTAFGAEGSTVQVEQEACFSLVQGSGCYGTRVLGTATVEDDGTWSLRVRVTRFLEDGTDCADPNILGSCYVSANVLDVSGNPDPTFGTARISLSFVGDRSKG